MVKKEKPKLRKFEYVEDRRCLMCDKPFVAQIYWAYGGKKMAFDHWIISSVYCSTKCSRKGHKIFREVD